MLKSDYIRILKELKLELQEEGFIIQGIFGSVARNENKSSSDLDVLYELDSQFRNSYRGFKAIARIDSIQQLLSEKLNIQIDLVQRSTLNQIGEKYILSELVNV